MQLVRHIAVMTLPVTIVVPGVVEANVKLLLPGNFASLDLFSKSPS
jgi:hypothetical protein